MVTHMHRTNISLQYPYLEILRMAMHDSKRVRMLYQSRTRPKPILREVDPYALIHRWGWWYMVGYCYLREAVRSFRVDRIREICLLEQEFTYPQDFNIHAYLETDVLSEQMQAVRIRFAAEAAPLIHADSAFWEKIDEQEDGTIIPTIKTSDMNYAANLIMSFSPLAEVLKPVELRKKISQRLQTAIKHYQNDLEEEQHAK
jgi:predicted DNA-binding transcriptional regulator YafY